MPRERLPHALPVLALAVMASATLLVAVPAVAVEQPPENDDFPWWCPPEFLPCNWFFGGGGITDCTQGTPCEKEACKCDKTRKDGEQACRSLPSYPGGLQACLAGVNEEYKKCLQMAQIICQGA